MKRSVRFPALLGAITLLALAAGCADDSAQAGTASASTATNTTTSGTTANSTTATSTTATDDTTPEPTAPSSPHLELTAIGDRLQVFSSAQYGTSTDFESATVYVAAVGGQFELTVSRPTFDDEITATARLGARRLNFGTSASVDFDGMDEFAHVELISSDGASVVEADVAFCPSYGSRIRTSPDGPPIDRFAASFCGGSIYSRATRWGISNGWAASLSDFIPFDTEEPLPPGEYELSIEINEPYSELFEGTTAVTLPATVTDDSDPTDTTSFEEGLSGIDDDVDGIDDAFDEYIDLDGDGLDDETLLTEAEIYGFEDVVEQDETYLSQDVIAEGAEEADEKHQGRPGPDAHPAKSTLPDLVSLPALGFGVTSENSLDLLGFEAITWNAGRAPMMVDGFVRKDDATLMDAYQQFFDHGVPAGSAPIGTFEYHAGGGHDHWHFLDFSRYELIDATGEVIQRAGKESWCLANTDAIDLTLPGASTGDGSEDLSTECGYEGSRWIRETLAVGWGDAYSPYVSGQYFDITDLPNGRYIVRLTANPEGNMYESDTTNNVADREITLGGTPGKRTVSAAKVGKIDTEAFFEPTGFGA